MQELISKICEKTGISQEQATTAIQTVTNFIKEKAPGIGDAVSNLLEKGGDAGGIMDSVTGKLGGLMGGKS